MIEIIIMIIIKSRREQESLCAEEMAASSVDGF